MKRKLKVRIQNIGLRQCPCRGLPRSDLQQNVPPRLWGYLGLPLPPRWRLLRSRPRDGDVDLEFLPYRPELRRPRTMLVQVCALAPAAPRECSCEAGESPEESSVLEGVVFRPPPCLRWVKEVLPWRGILWICGRCDLIPRKRSRCHCRSFVKARSSFCPRHPGPGVVGVSPGCDCVRGLLLLRASVAGADLLERGKPPLGSCWLIHLPVCGIQEGVCC